MGFFICFIILLISSFFVFHAMVGYPLFLFMINKLKKPKRIITDNSFEPHISLMIVAHNEEKVILQKLENILSLNYPLDKIQILIASDFCTDKTDEIVERFASEHKYLKIQIHKSKEHKGKTNAQNETQKLANGEILVMTDANSLFEPNSIRELVKSFTNEDIYYVCGQLKYCNDENLTASSESTYWKLELKQREIESNIQTITAGNGSIYAVRNSAYFDASPIHCHDSFFPRAFALKKKRCLYNPDAVAYEKAGETNSDEFKRKVRMNRDILSIFVNMWRPLNIFRYRWFSFFYFSHRTLRYLLWFNHFVFFLTSIALVIIGHYIFGGILVALQVVFFVLGIISINKKIKPKLIRLIGYYSMTVIAQQVAVVKQITGRSKPVWEKAESTR